MLVRVPDLVIGVLGPPDTFGPGFPFVIVVPLTTVRRGLSLHIEVEASAETGVDATSYIQCELIRSINHNRLPSPRRHRTGHQQPGHQRHHDATQPLTDRSSK
jgi:mRNA-degrading endonuclease toxin of MazEF toxin-antitoxin module